MKKFLFVSLVIGLFTFSAFAQGASDGGRSSARYAGGGGADTGGKGKYGGGGSDSGGKGKISQMTVAGGGGEHGGKGKYSLTKTLVNKSGGGGTGGRDKAIS